MAPSVTVANAGNAIGTVSGRAIAGNFAVAKQPCLWASARGRYVGIASSGDVKLLADQLDIGAPVSAAGRVNLIPLTASRAITLGGADELGALNLTQAELDNSRPRRWYWVNRLPAVA